MILLVVALFGLLVPNGFFLYWLVNEFQGIRPIVANHLAMGFILDAFMAMIILAVYFARRPSVRCGRPHLYYLDTRWARIKLAFYWGMNTHRSQNKALELVGITA